MSCSALKSPASDITEFKLVNPPVAKAPEWVYFKQYASYDNRKDFAVCNFCYEEEKSEANSKKRKYEINVVYKITGSKYWLVYYFNDV
jgi:hypothetical protein